MEMKSNIYIYTYIYIYIYIYILKRSVIGLFGRVMNNNVELCSDWLFHCAAQC